MDSTPARIVVELTPGAVPITGNVLASAQESRPFTGWIGLFAALRAATREINNCGRGSVNRLGGRDS
jgi:hypothetical protein